MKAGNRAGGRQRRGSSPDRPADRIARGRPAVVLGATSAAVVAVATLAAGLVTLTFPALSGAAGAGMDGAKPGELVRVADGRRINLRCLGDGAPTVILESGYEANSMAWWKVEPQVARFTRVCSYDRAGAGFSDPGPLPRDGVAIAGDLDQALKAGGVRGPLVLVGHSAGGLYMRLFVRRRPAQVVGMVLVDPSIDHQDRQMAALFGPQAGSLEPLIARAKACLAAAARGDLPSTSPDLARCAPAARTGEPSALAAEETAENIRPSTWRTRISELDNLWTRTSDEIDGGPVSLGDMPLVVLTAGQDNARAPSSERLQLDEAWAGFHRQLAALSTRGSAQLVADSSHLMMRDRPDAVVEAIREVVSAVRKHR